MAVEQGIETVTGPFVTQVHVKGIRPPVRLEGMDVRGWPVASRGTDLLYLDECGALWWGRARGKFDASVVRECWPEETLKFHPAICHSIEQILAA